jgi:hypothetical protein
MGDVCEREVKELGKGQETRRLIDQMQTKHAEELTRINRQETFRKGPHNPG